MKTEKQAIAAAGSRGSEFQKSMDKYQRAFEENGQPAKTPPGKKL
jgi:hypothetical protein